jgi:hypothetical protein
MAEALEWYEKYGGSYDDMGAKASEALAAYKDVIGS